MVIGNSGDAFVALNHPQGASLFYPDGERECFWRRVNSTRHHVGRALAATATLDMTTGFHVRRAFVAAATDMMVVSRWLQ